MSKADTERDLPLILGALRQQHLVDQFCIAQQSRIDRSLEGLLATMLFGYAPRKGQKADGSAKAVFVKVHKRIEEARKSGPDDALHALIAANDIARATFDQQRNDMERAMSRTIRSLPIWTSWAADIKGLGALSLGRILAETGDLSGYASVSKVWKRLGLAVIDGNRQGRPGSGASAEDWIAHGYSPKRRSIVYVTAETLFRKQWAGARDNDGVDPRKSGKPAATEAGPTGPYGQIYKARKDRTAITHPDWTRAHAHNDALRIMSKALLRDLWIAWRVVTKAEHELKAGHLVPSHAAPAIAETIAPGVA